jgi:dephospho-CoA kinase
VIDSDEQVRQVYNQPEVRQTLRQWWGDAAFTGAGEVDRAAIARRVFVDPLQRQRLERLLHPRVSQLRDRAMAAAGDDAQVIAYVWDTPLLFETHLNRHCDAVVFVDAPMDQRVARVRASRQWEPSELILREKSQMPLDRKREMSDYVISNTADVDFARRQVSDVLSRIVDGSMHQPNLGDGCPQADKQAGH